MSDSGWHRKATDTPAHRARVKTYNSREHKQQRRSGQRQVDAGTATCWRCGEWIPPGTAWHVGHDDHDRTIYRGTEHITCNLSAAARKGNAMTSTPPLRAATSYPIRTQTNMGGHTPTDQDVQDPPCSFFLERDGGTSR